MDATQKSRMRKIAMAHFLLSIVFALFVFEFASKAHAFSGPPEAKLAFQTHVAWSNAWSSVWVAGFCLLQPQFWLISKIADFVTPIGEFFSKASIWATGPLFLLSIPLWSYGFSWLFVKLDNWLNHFSVLGRKVF